MSFKVRSLELMVFAQGWLEFTGVLSLKIKLMICKTLLFFSFLLLIIFRSEERFPFFDFEIVEPKEHLSVSDVITFH